MNDFLFRTCNVISPASMAYYGTKADFSCAKKGKISFFRLFRYQPSKNDEGIPSIKGKRIAV